MQHFWKEVDVFMFMSKESECAIAPAGLDWSLTFSSSGNRWKDSDIAPPNVIQQLNAMTI